jgi:hypothetical protein
MPNLASTSLTKLFRRMIISFIISLIGSWGLIIQRLYIIKLDSFKDYQDLWLYFDIISLSLAIFGVFMLIYYKHIITPRLQRLDSLGESRW